MSNTIINEIAINKSEMNEVHKTSTTFTNDDGRRPNPSSLPTTVMRVITEPHTDLLVSVFQDRVQILISQIEGKIGTMLSVTHEFSQIDNSHTYHIQNLLGKRDDPLDSVYARQIMERIVNLGDGYYCPPLLVGINLIVGKSSPEDFRKIVDEVVDMYQEAVGIIRANS